MTVAVTETVQTITVNPGGSVAVSTPATSTVVEVSANVGGGGLLLSDPIAATIASGAITIVPDTTKILRYQVAPESGVSDTLDTINGGVDGQMLRITTGPSANNNVITVSGALILSFPFGLVGDLVLNNDLEWIDLWYQGGAQGPAWLAIKGGGSPYTKVVNDDGTDAAVAFSLFSSFKYFGMEDFLVLKPEGKTIASDKVTGVIGNIISVDTEAAAASDNLASLKMTINFNGQQCYVRPTSDARTIVIKHNDGTGTVGGRFFCPGGADITLDDLSDFAILLYDEALDSGSGGWAVR